MIKHYYVAFILLFTIGCKTREKELDKLVIDNLTEPYIERSILYNTAINHLKGDQELDYKVNEYYTLDLDHSVKEEHVPEVSKELFKSIAKTFHNICVIRKSQDERYMGLKYSLLRELRIFKTSMFNQNELNELMRCENLINIDFSYSSEQARRNIEIDSIPKSISNLKKIQVINLDVFSFFEQRRPDYLLEYSRDSTNEDHYNPNFKYDHPLDFIWLPEFPESFGELPLKVLRMSGNKANTFQSCVGDLKELEELVLVGHNFDSGLEHIGRIKTLKRLQLDLGASSGKLPDDVFNGLEELEELNITWEDLPRLPASIGKLKNLKVLKILYCHEITEIPDEIKSLFPQLEYLKIKGCKNIPNQIIDRRN